jgi:serine/threonine protein kinase
LLPFTIWRNVKESGSWYSSSFPARLSLTRLARSPLSAGEALAVFQQIASPLDAAHEKSIIHSDLKPANVMIAPDRKVKLLDFGLEERHRRP